MITARNVRKGGLWLLSLILGGAFLFPLYVDVITSMDTARDLFTFPPHLTPDFNFHPYAVLWSMAPWPLFFVNTILITGLTIAIALATSVLAAYALSFLRFKARELIFMALILVLMIPFESLLIPNYIILHMMNLINTYWAQILPFGCSVFGIFLLRQFLLSLPTSYWEAARMDGASHLRFLWSIVLPMARPVLYTIGLYIFVGTWNAFQWPLIVTVSPGVQPIEVAVSHLILAHSTDWRRLSAAGVIVTIPLVILFFFVQKYIISGISRSEGVQG